MPINSYKMFDGSLTLTVGGGSPLDVSCQVTSAAVEPQENVTSTDAIPVLCGDELPAEESASYTYRLKGTLLQDLAAAGVIAVSWDNAGEDADFVLVPNTVADRQVSGTCRLAPLKIGGDVSKTNRPTSDFDWFVVGTPDFEDATP